MVKGLGKRGFTLTEAMVTVALLGGLSMMAAPLMRNLTNFWRQTSARFTIQRDVRASLEIMDRFLRQAQNTTVVIDQAVGQPPYSRIAFTSVTGDTFQFYQQGNKLMMKKNTTVSALSTNVAYIAFSYPRSDDTTLISVAVTMQAPTYLGGRKALQLSIQKVRIMN